MLVRVLLRHPATRRPHGALATLFGALLLASAPVFAQPRVIEPGTFNGPTRFDAPEVSGSQCLPNAGALVAGAGLGTPQIGCLVPDAPGGGIPPASGRLQASTVTLLCVGPSLFRGRTFEAYEFEVSPSPTGRASAVPAKLTVDVDVKGFLAALLAGHAGVEVGLEVHDVTGSEPRLVAGTTIFEQGIEGGVSTSLGVNAGVSMPEPSGSVGASVSAGMKGEVALINEKGSETLALLLQRGHRYRVQVTLESSSGVGIGGGLALSGFFSPAGNELFSKVPDIRWLRLLLDSLADSVAPPSGPEALVPDFLSVAEYLQVPAFQIPGFEIDPRSAALDIPDQQVASQSASRGGWSPAASAGLSLSVGEVSGTLPGFDVVVDEASVSVPGFTFDGFDFPAQTLLPFGPITSLEALVDQVDLPAFDQGFGGTVLLDWMEPLLAEPFVFSSELSPLVDAILNGSGARVESMTLTLEEDVSQMGSQITDTVGDSQAAVVASVDSARSNLLGRLDEVRGHLQATIQASSDALSARVSDESTALDGKLADWVTLNLRTKIEDNLAASGRSPVASFLLPARAPFYGFLEEARQIVAETIERMVEANQDVFNAESELAEGDAAYAEDNYGEAYSHYRRAYSAAVK